MGCIGKLQPGAGGQTSLLIQKTIERPAAFCLRFSAVVTVAPPASRTGMPRTVHARNIVMELQLIAPGMQIRGLLGKKPSAFLDVKKDNRICREPLDCCGLR